MDWLGIAFRWAHIIPAIILIGGGLFMRFALIPAAETLPDDIHDKLREAVRQRWAKWVHGSVALLLVSGLVNFALVLITYDVPKSSYHPIVGTKALLGIVALLLASILVGRSKLAVKLRENFKFWLSVNLALGFIVVALGGVAKFLPHPLKVEIDQPVVVEGSETVEESN